MADINSIIDPKLVEELKKMNDQLVIAGTNMDKLIPITKQLNDITNQISKSTGENTNKKKQLTEAEKESERIKKAIIQTETKINALNDESSKKLTQLRTQLQQNTKSVKDLQRAQLAQKGSTEQLLAVNVILEKRLRNVNQATDEGKKKADLLRSAIDKNNKKITEQSSALTKQKRGIGGYSEGIQDAVSKTGFFSRELMIVSRIQATITLLTKKQTTAQNASTAATSLGTKALNIFKVALISTGIGALVVALGSLVTFFKASEEGAASLQRIMSPFKILFGNIKDVVISMGGAIANAFENPKEAVIGLWEVIKTNIVNRFKGLIDTYKFLGKTIEAAFKLDWQSVKENAGKAGESILQTVTGVDDAYNKATKAVKGFIDETKKENEQNKKLANEKLALIKRERSASIELAKLEIEIQDLRLKLKDEENFSNEQRLEFAKQAQEAIRKQGAIESELAAKRLAHRKLENSFSTSSQEDLDAEAQLEVALINTKSDAVKKSLRIESEKQTVIRKIKADEIAFNKQVDATLLEEQTKFNEETEKLLEKDAEKYIQKLDNDVEETIKANKKKLDDFEKTEEIRTKITEDDENRRMQIKEQVGNAIFDIAKNNLDRQLENENLTEEERKKIEKKATMLEMAKSIFQIGLQAAKDIFAIKAQAAVLAANPFTAFLAHVALAQIPKVLKGAAIASGTIAALKIPAFATGTDYAPGGLSLVGESGRELIQTPRGEVFMANNPALINLERGSKVITNRKTEAYLNDGNIVNELRQTRKAIQRIPQPIFKNGSKIAERRGNYWVNYRNDKHRLN